MKIRIALTLDVDPEQWAKVRGSQVADNSIDARRDLRGELCEFLDTYLREEGLGEVVKLHHS